MPIISKKASVGHDGTPINQRVPVEPASSSSEEESSKDPRRKWVQAGSESGSVAGSETESDSNTKVCKVTSQTCENLLQKTYKKLVQPLKLKKYCK